MIDDLQFLIGKDATQEEFFHTFNALVDAGKQIVVSADKSPSDLSGLEERVRTRLGSGMVADLQPTVKAMKKAASLGYATATDLADWLVQTLGVPFRHAHHITGALVGEAAKLGVPLEKLPLDVMQAHEPRITEAVYARLGVENSVKSRMSYGGTAPVLVRRAAKKWLKNLAQD